MPNEDAKEFAAEIRKNHPPRVARIIFDSALSPLPSGIRGMVADRHLLFVDQNFDLHLKISVEGRQKEIYGQVIPRVPTEDPLTVTLMIQEKPTKTTLTAPFGEFSFLEVPTGNIAVEIAMPSRRVIAVFDA